MTAIVTGNVHVCAYVMGCDVMWRACEEYGLSQWVSLPKNV